MITVKQISQHAFDDENEIITEYLSKAGFYKQYSGVIYKQASLFVHKIREENSSLSIENFLKEFSLDTYEGVAILCLAEALLRIPDNKTADDFIKDKLTKGDWKSHLNSDSTFMLNFSSFAFLLSGEVLSLSKVENKLWRKLGSLVERAGEPVIREAIKKGVELLGGKFVIGNNVDEALKKSEELKIKGYNFSFDMLGEGARTADQAEKYFGNYINGIKKLVEKYQGKLSKNIYDNPNISVKLSALHPRYELLKKERVFAELLPKLKEIAKLCKENNLWLSIDAEESWRLEISLLLYQELLNDSDLKNYNGLGFVVQAYGKRALKTIKFLTKLAEKHKIKIPVRLVKGAYWDSEIKYAQVNGLPSYPVFTRKSHTDLSYLVCAEELIKNAGNLYPQFATHSAYTVAAILELTKNQKTEQFEFQKLYGMGDDLYDQIIHKVHCRIYAPVGSYEELLPYLIRRILENGANNSFISLVANKEKALSEILKSPLEKIETGQYTGKYIPLPSELYNPRKNSSGFCFGNIAQVEYLSEFVKEDITKTITPKSLIAGKKIPEEKIENAEVAINYAQENFDLWAKIPVEKRAKILENFANEIENNFGEIFNILIYEAKKTAKDAVSEIREAIDFLRFYSLQAREVFAEKQNRGYTGESSVSGYRGKGIFVCISPWNFPLAIFLGQISAALVAGNCVIAKPAEQTPKIAYFITKLAYRCGIPDFALQLILGKGETIGAALISNNNIVGVAFTGSTKTAWIINRALASRNAPIATLIAETGGQNCMMVDSTVLLEKTCDDIIESSFHSAGQRCSALRVCYIQEEIFDDMVALLQGAIAELEIGLPNNFSVDVPPVIDAEAKESLGKHVGNLNKFVIASEKAQACRAKQSQEIEPHNNSEIASLAQDKPSLIRNDAFSPVLIQIPSIKTLEKENFGPILHLVKFKKEDTDKIIEEINSTGYGLTFGIQSRIQDYIKYVTSKIRAGNIYINRSTIGAVVETHPFGGAGLSGTGPKAGGINYIKRFVEEYTVTENTASIGGNLELLG